MCKCVYVHARVGVVCECAYLCVYVSLWIYTNVSGIGIFEKPSAEAQAAAKSRRLNLLEVHTLVSSQVDAQHV